MMTGTAEKRRVKFRMRIRKMKPEIITVRRRNVQGEKVKKNVWARSLISCIFFSLHYIDRNQPVAGEDIDQDVPTRAPEQIQIETIDDHSPSSTRGQQRNRSPFHQPCSPVAFANGFSNGDEGMYPNIIQVMEQIGINSPSSHESPLSMFSPLHSAADLPGFIGDSSTDARATSPSLPRVINVELTNVHSHESLQSRSPDQKGADYKKEKKSIKEKLAARKYRKKNKCTKKIPTVKEWAKQQEKNRKAEEKQQKVQLKKEMEKQKEMEKKIAKETKKKEAEKRKEEKELKKAEKKAAKVKKAAEKAQKAAAKAEAKKKKHSKKELQQQKALKESEAAAERERERSLLLEQKRKREANKRRLRLKIARTEDAMDILQEKLERKEKKHAHLIEQREQSDQLPSMLDAFKLHYKISDIKREILNIKIVIARLNESVTAKKRQQRSLTIAPFLVQTVTSSEAQDEARRLPAVHNDTGDDCSILDMMCCFDSDSEDSENEEEEEEEEYNTPFHVQNTFYKGQVNPYKMSGMRTARRCSHKREQPKFVCKRKGPVSGRKTE